MANVSIRMDDTLKKQAEDLFNDLGMNLTTAFKEVEEMKKNPSLGKSYTDVDEMMEDLL